MLIGNTKRREAFLLLTANPETPTGTFHSGQNVIDRRAGCTKHQTTTVLVAFFQLRFECQP